MELAKKLIDVAAEAGADLVKFQTFSGDRLATPTAKQAEYQIQNTEARVPQRNMLQKLELDENMHEVLIQHCEDRGIGFFSTGFDIESVNLLIKLGQKRFKIPSGEITNLPLLRHIGKQKKEVILSTGMASFAEIEKAIEAIEYAGTSRDSITVLHCTTSYPAPLADVNLKAMQKIGEKFDVAIGYSDHTVGLETAIAAVALGAKVIEKHFTLDRKLPGPDHKASLEPEELKQMISYIRNIEILLGDGNKKLMPSEVGNVNIARKSIVASKNVMEGEVFSDQNITTKRPGNGISPMEWDSIIGTNAIRDFEVDELVER